VGLEKILQKDQQIVEVGEEVERDGFLEVEREDQMDLLGKLGNLRDKATVKAYDDNKHDKLYWKVNGMLTIRWYGENIALK